MMGVVAVNGHAPGSMDAPLLVVHKGRQIVLPPLARLLLTKQQQQERTRLLLGQFFLVNMSLGDLGEIFRCGRCNGKHVRLTRYCLDRPFSGLLGGLYGFVMTVQQAEAAGRLPPEAQDRVDRIRRLFGVTTGLMDLAASHPDLARQLAGGSNGTGNVDLDVGMISLGLLERIEPRDAQWLLDRINTRAAAYGAPPLVVPGLKSPDLPGGSS
jgi:hypothetical protein